MTIVMIEAISYLSVEILYNIIKVTE